MAEGRSRRLCRWVRITAAILVGLLLLQVVFDPLPLLSDIISVTRIRWELPRAVERWESHAPPAYQVHVKGAIPMTCLLDAELFVRDGRLAGVRARTDPLVPDSPLKEVDPSDWQQPCPYEDLTVERMFERVETSLEGLGGFGAPLTVEFDEEWGYISAYRFGRAERGGVFGYQISECCTWFAFDRLTVLAP